MAAAGYDVALGDSWMLNELNSAVRRGDGNARANVREFLRGLYEGDGRRPTKGAVLVIGFGQRTSNVSLYQSTLQSWLTDSAFDRHGDLRRRLVAGGLRRSPRARSPGQPVPVRRDYLNDYLQHKLLLAGAGPPEIEPARAYLREAYSALANGAWPRESAWGGRWCPSSRWRPTLSAQVDALRSFSATSGQTRDHWGFAWAPSNTTGMPSGDFAAQTERSSTGSPPRSVTRAWTIRRAPGAARAAPTSPCARSISRTRDTTRRGDRSAPGRSRSSRSAPPRDRPRRRRRVGPARALDRVGGCAAGVRDAPFELGRRRVLDEPRGAVDERPDRLRRARHARRLLLPRHASRQTHRVRARHVAGDTPGRRRGRCRCTRHGHTGCAGGTSTRRGRVHRRRDGRLRESRCLAALLDGRAGDARHRHAGRGASVRFRAGRVLGSGTVTARAGSLAGSATVVIRPATLRVRTVDVGITARGARVTLAALDGARRPVSRAAVTLVARLDGRRVARVQGVTGAAGKARLQVALGRGCVSLVVTRARADGSLGRPLSTRPPLPSVASVTRG